MRTPRSRLALMGVVLVLALAGAGCSGDDESAAPTNAGDSDGPSGPACGQVPAEGPASFDGMSGELDHVLAGAALAKRVTGATIWHVNSDEPTFLDYNTEYNQPRFYRPDPFRSSDHDPVLVGLRLH